MTIIVQELNYWNFQRCLVFAEIQSKSGHKNLREAATKTKSDEMINFNQNLKDIKYWLISSHAILKYLGVTERIEIFIK